ncbi:Nascent polypeptide-associated complex subunit alpha [Wickerhamiella sorbophila]|uniref:Nascent polypeptide-associated complex subunit alpha n=1 Tax=Wickerhamiella sorbophila TaxID=45607 RepID=A0A2T0FC08_9ASCO|nr:Nascent polypeptide-associated complex subunit alpha [Wickerhamiella sorbophila]PRT52542.1 Nascent polypeptide-associated complex subunit alpha [Wickerhamiella sorbophila]
MSSDAKIVELPNETENQPIEEGATVNVISRNEKKARKLLKGTGIKKVEGVNRVVLRRRGGSSFVISNPEVYRTPNGSYIVFGTAQVHQQDFAQQLAQLGGQAAAGAAGADDKSPEAINADLEAAVSKMHVNGEPEEEDDAEVDVTGLDEEKLTLVMEQANVSKAKAAKALRENNGDLVNSLMALTS